MLNLEHFLAKRIIKSIPNKNTISVPIIKIGISAISLSLIIIVFSFAVTKGMQNEIKSKIYSLNGFLKIQSYGNFELGSKQKPISPDSILLAKINKKVEVKKVEKIIEEFCIVRTSKEFDAIIFKGVNSNYDFSRIKKYIVRGTAPNISNKYSKEVLISKSTATRLNIDFGQKIEILFSRESQKNPFISVFTVSGILETGFKDMDEMYLLGDYTHLQRINNWEDNEVGSLEVHLKKIDDDVNFSYEIYNETSSDYDIVTTSDNFYSVFEWIKLFDKNNLIIIFIMSFIGVINIISIIIILILEKVNLIGLLKALGATNNSIRKYYLYIASYLISKGLFIGNLISVFIIFIQKKFKIIKLDPNVYYVDFLPLEISFIDFAFANFLVFIICIISIFFPVSAISKIVPRTTIKFD
ncbi:MAG: ABC transporter permease [Flavobacteriaceae bacterium]